MKMLNALKALILLGAFSMTACSSSSGGGGTAQVSNLITNTYSAVNSQAEKASGNLGDSAFVPVSGVLQPRATTFGANWATNNVVNNPVTNSGMIPIMDYMIIQLTPELTNPNNASVNVFGRMNTALRIFCAVGVATGIQGVATDSAGYPANGTYSITFTSTIASLMESQCGMDASDVVGETVQLTVAAASGSYDKSFALDGFQQMYYVKATSTQVNIATGEVHDGGVGQSRTMLAWNKTTNVMTVEYVSAPACSGPCSSGLYGYRLYYDETNDDGQILTYEGDNTSFSNSVQYILAGQPQTGSEFALSMVVDSVNGSDAMNACISGETGAMVTDGSLCGGYTAVVDGVSVAGVLSDFYDNRDETTWSTISETSVMNWTDKASMLTAPFDPTL